MPRASYTILWWFLVTLVPLAEAQTPTAIRSISLQVVDAHGRGIQGVVVSPTRDGSRSRETDANGLTTMLVSGKTGPGTRLSLIIDAGTARRLVLVSPWDTQIHVPAENDSLPLKLVLVEEGKREMFSSPVVVEAMIKQIFNRQQPKVAVSHAKPGHSAIEEVRQQNLDDAVNAVASSYGVSGEDVRAAIEDLAKHGHESERAWALLFEEKVDQAELLFREAAKRQTADLVDSFRGLARSLSNQGRFREAIQTYQKAMTLDPNSPSLLANLAEVQEYSGESISEAEANYKKAFELALEQDIEFSRKTNILQLLILFYDRHQMLAQVKETIKERQQLNQQFTARYPKPIFVADFMDASDWAVEVLAKYHQDEDVLSIRQSVIDFCRTSCSKDRLSNAYGKLAEWYFGIGEFEKSIEQLQRIYDLNKGDGNASFARAAQNLGEAYMNKGSLKEARQYFEESIEALSKTHPTSDLMVFSLSGLADVALREGKLADSDMTFKKAVRAAKNQNPVKASILLRLLDARTKSLQAAALQFDKENSTESAQAARMQSESVRRELTPSRTSADDLRQQALDELGEGSNPEDVQPLLAQAVRIYELNGASDEKYFSALTALAKCFIKLNRLQDALAPLKKVVSGGKKDTADYGYAMFRLGITQVFIAINTRVYPTTEEGKNQLDMAEQGLAIQEEFTVGMDAELYCSYQELSGFYSGMREYDKAIALVRKTIERFHQSGRPVPDVLTDELEELLRKQRSEQAAETATPNN